MSFAQLLPAKEEITVLKTIKGDIYGKLLIPSSKSSSPVIILIAGSGPTDMDGNSSIRQMNNNSLKFLAENLSRHGYAVLRYDKRGVGLSMNAGKVEKELRFDDYVNDAKGWINQLSKDKRFNSIIVAGHSEGSLVGMVACLGNRHVKAFISIAGAGRPADELIEEQVCRQSKDLLQLVRPINRKLKLGKTVNDVPQALYVLFRPSVQPYLISWYMFDPRKIIAGLKIPVLIVQGTTDIQVSQKDAEALKVACPSAKFVLIDGMNHVMKSCPTLEIHQQAAVYANPQLSIHPQLIDEITRFMSSLN